MKRNQYLERRCNCYFWRTYDQKEIDLVEEEGGELAGFEFKWTEKKMQSPKLFLTTYPNATYRVIHKQDYLDFIT
jgi:hypothetical protein